MGRATSRASAISALAGYSSRPRLAVPIGTEVELLFALPEGEARIHGIVRYADGKNGFGVEFTSMGEGDRARLEELLRRLNR